MDKKPIEWFKEPKDKNYPAAESYLSLIYDEETAINFVKLLKQAPLSEFKSRDIFRASGLPLLGISNSQIVKNKQKIAEGEALSPILLIRDKANGKVVIADGYHRVCSVYMHDDEAMIPCKII